MSMLEVYNETVRDLLGVRDSREGLPKLEIRIVADGVSQSVSQSVSKGTLPQYRGRGK